MIFISIILLLLTIGLVIFMPRSRKLTALIPAFILIVSIIFSGLKIIDSTTVGVTKRLGVITGTAHSGINFLNPFLDTVDEYDLKVHVGSAEFASYTKDAQPVTAIVEYQFELDPEYAVNIAKTYGSQEMHENKIGNIVEEKVKTVFAKYGAMSLLENRANLSTELDIALTPLEEMFHINFKSIIVKDIDFSDAFEKSVEAKMEAEQNALKAEQDKKKALIEAEQAKEVAEIQAQAEVAKAQGEADAMMITKDALEKMPEAYIQQMWIERWNGELPTVVADGNSMMFDMNEILNKEVEE